METRTSTVEGDEVRKTNEEAKEEDEGAKPEELGEEEYENFARLCRQVSIPEDPSVPDYITEGEVEEFKESLEMYDREGLGRVPLPVLEIILHYLGQMPSTSHLHDMYKYLDPREEGNIDFYRYLELMGKALRKLDDEDTVRKAFQYFDKDGCGLIGEKDMRFNLTNYCLKLTDQEVENMIEAAGGLDENRKFRYETLIEKMLATRDS